jgi:flagellar basal body-associated protein FliL
MNNRRSLSIIVLLVVGLSLVAAPVAATISITASSEYLGGEDGNPNAIEIEYTFSPDGTEATNIRVEFVPTDSSFIEYNSFSRIVNPGDADVSIENTDQGTYNIDSVESNQEITFRFRAYPKTIQEQQLDAAVVQIDYVQQGQSLSETTPITADLSNSAWFQLQNVQGGNGGSLLLILIVLIVGVGLGAGTMYMVGQI